jgi:hypothetical protein
LKFSVESIATGILPLLSGLMLSGSISRTTVMLAGMGVNKRPWSEPDCAQTPKTWPASLIPKASVRVAAGTPIVVKVYSMAKATDGMKTKGMVTMISREIAPVQVLFVCFSFLAELNRRGDKGHALNLRESTRNHHVRRLGVGQYKPIKVYLICEIRTIIWRDLTPNYFR